MMIEFDPEKDAANRSKHGVPLAYGQAVFADPDRLIIPTIREADGEDRYKAIGKIGNRLWTVIHIYRGDAVRFVSVRRSNVNEQRAYDSDTG